MKSETKNRLLFSGFLLLCMTIVHIVTSALKHVDAVVFFGAYATLLMIVVPCFVIYLGWPGNDDE